MDKELLTRHVIEVLNQAGFITSEQCYVRPRSFDLASRRGSILILHKILSNIDGLNERTAMEIRRLAKYLLGSAILVGEKTRDHFLERGAVYFRYGVPTMNLHTLADFLLDNVPPLAYATHGGLYVKIDGTLLRQLRLEREISLGALAAELGVSRRTVSKYEMESMDTSIDVALRLEEVFDHELIQPVNIFESRGLDNLPEKVDDHILTRLSQMGFDVFPTTQAPFKAITQDEDMIVLIGVSKYSASMLKKARLMSSLSMVAMTKSAVIVDGKTKIECVEETALIERQELENIDKTCEFADLVFEKQNKPEG